MTEDRPPAVRPDEATAPVGQEEAARGTGDERRHGAVRRVASAVGEGAITIPVVHRYLGGIAVPRPTGR
jgi:hypothetical protein